MVVPGATAVVAFDDGYSPLALPGFALNAT